MADIVDKATRSRMMRGIRSANTRPEILVRQILHRAGFRFRLHVRALAGTPDIVLPRHHAVVFVHGCFWHGHNCPLFRLPATRSDFWSAKLNRNRINDAKSITALRAMGWRVAVVWECALRASRRRTTESLAESLSHWIKSASPSLNLAGRKTRPA